MNAEQGDPMLARYADVAPGAGDDSCVCAADGSPFGPATTERSTTCPPPPGGPVSAAITVADYDAHLRRAGLTDVSIEPTDPLGGGLQNASIRAAKPAIGVRAVEPAD